MDVARKEVLVQLDDELIAALDKLAAKLQVSRSELLRRGAAAMLEAADVAEADAALVEAYKRYPQDPLFGEVLTKLAADNAPKW